MKNNQEMKNSRRSFLKGSLVAGAAAAAGTVALGVPQALAAQDASGDAATQPKHSWEAVPDPIPASKITATVDVDVVVVGAGVAGIFAANSAVEGGLKVALLEKFKTYSVRAKDNGAVNTKVQKRLGMHIDENEMAARLIQFSQNRVHHKLVRDFVFQSGRVFDHYIDMCEANGVSVDVLPEYKVNAVTPSYPTAHNFFLKNQAHSTGSEYVPTQVYLVRVVEKACKDKGVDFHYNTAAKQLIKDKDGRITGVIAKVKGGGYTQFNAKKAVILAVGGYTENQEMLDTWAPWAKYAEIPCYTPIGGNQGEGIAMALWAGASLMKPPFPIMIHTIPAPPLGNDSMAANQTFLHVNKNGERYEDENQPDPFQCNTRFMQPDGKAWAIFSSSYFKDQAPIKTSMGGPVNEPAEALEDSISKGMAFKAATLSELAGKIGIPADKLAKTVARYSELAKKGKDEDFGKQADRMFPIEQAPFFAVPIKSHLLVTVGSLNVNPEMQCLDTNSVAIPGLFAVGNTMGNFFGVDYPLMAPGISSGRCIVMSHLLGERLAKA
ncbi:FAD-dependent oxidoreductase [Telmatobacter bradus]|uniref:FAD-dependent oxidoreductase n=1 Tax=Telmatobacter bradus TaxID=474953 RepID=UPI003B42A802